MMFLFAILLYVSNSAVLGKTLGSDDVMSRIIMGNYASIQEYPFFASIINKYQHYCGAAIISDRWLLTAAHCISNNNVYVVGGDRNDNGYIVTADMYVKHPYYVYDTLVLDNDIAMVRLASRLQFSEKVQPIRLPASYEVKKPLLALGKGYTEYGSASPYLMKVDIMEVDYGYCYVGGFDKEHFICTTRSPVSYANICSGDSGSPLISYGDFNATLVGIVSFIINQNCLINRYSAFTRVYYYVPWIQTVMAVYNA